VMSASVATRRRAVVGLVCLLGALLGYRLSAAGDPPTPGGRGAPATAGRAAEGRQPRAVGRQPADPLPEGALNRLGTTRFRQGLTVLALGYFPNGKHLLSGSYFGAMN